MKRFLLIVLLLALVGSMAFAVVVTRNKPDKQENKKAVPEKKQVKKRSGCGSYY